MKRCPQCSQTYDDQTLFCLADGTQLQSLMDTSSDATVISSAPFSRQIQQSAPARRDFNFTFVFLGIGLLLLILAGAGFAMWSLSGSSVSDTAAREKDLQRREQELANAEKEKLQSEQENLARERQFLEEEKARLGSAKQQQSNTLSVQTEAAVSNAGAAIIFAPPSNVRDSPNGRILCSVTKRTTIKTYGSTGVYDKNGVWIYTDICGSMGVIHSTQIKY